MPPIKPSGVDLGTTNSAMAWVDESGRSQMVVNAEGDLITPSVVFFSEDEVVVGKNARTAITAHPDMVAQWVKRDMGAPFYSHPIRGHYLPPEVIQACILRKLRVDIMRVVGPGTETVITVPAYFDELRRKATADAGEMAGLRVLDIVNEPTAAALAFGEALGYLSADTLARHEFNVMVYDLGGGTFDATLLHLAPGKVQTFATDGDVQLGGHDWDQRLVDFAADAFRKAHGIDPRQDPATLNRLYQDAMEAKHTLTARSRASIQINYAGRSLDVPLGREQFEEMAADLLERTAYTSRQLLATAGLQWSDLERVLLVGGSTRMPMIPRMLKKLTGIEPDRMVNPDEAVSRGAALYASYLLSKRDGAGKSPFQVTNVNAHSLGVEGIDTETLRKKNVTLIRRNSPLPVKHTERFATKSEGQRSIVIKVLEGESSLPSECITIGRTVVRDLPTGLPKGWPVEITFEYATNGRLSIHALVPGTQHRARLELEREVGLSGEGIARWKVVVDAAAGFGTFETISRDATSALDAAKAATSGIGSSALGWVPAGQGATASAAAAGLYSSAASGATAGLSSSAAPAAAAGLPSSAASGAAAGLSSSAGQARTDNLPSGKFLSAPTPLGGVGPAAGAATATDATAGPVKTLASQSGVSPWSQAPAEPQPDLTAIKRKAKAEPRIPLGVQRLIGSIVSGLLGIGVGLILFKWLRPDLVDELFKRLMGR